jgi:hypothetical protein
MPLPGAELQFLGRPARSPLLYLLTVRHENSINLLRYNDGCEAGAEVLLFDGLYPSKSQSSKL